MFQRIFKAKAYLLLSGKFTIWTGDVDNGNDFGELENDNGGADDEDGQDRDKRRKPQVWLALKHN